MRFIVFEGLDAAGKSTLINKVEEQLKQKEIKIQRLRDPGSTLLGEELRNIILATDSEAPVARAETLLYQAARVQMVEKKIKPALQDGWVLCDRFYSSTVAFQVFARGLKMEDITALNDFVASDCRPDLFIFLDIPVEESLKRKENRSKETGVEQDRMEKESRDFQSKVREGYLHQAKQDPQHWLVLDATLSPDQLTQQVMDELEKKQWALIEEIFGHEKNKENLLARIQELPSSLVFYGPPGIGKKKLVRGLLQRLNCSRDAKACGHCSACTRSLEKKNEMILEVSLEEKKSISVDQVRDVHDFIALKTMSPARFIIIDPADKLTVQASNALLKILEEPPERTHFFLIAETLSNLLPTIRSRSSIFRFQALSADQLQRVEGVKSSAVAWARGRADLALALSDPSGEEGLNAAQEMLITLLESVPLDWKKHYPAFFQDQNSHRFFIPVWEEMLSKKMRGEPFTKADSLPNENSALLAVFESLQSLRGELTKSFDKILCLENFYYQLQRTRKNPEAALWI